MQILDGVDAVCSMTDVVARNRRISDVYHDLAVALSRRNPNLTWCAYAVWASASAGRIIAGDEVPAMFRGMLERSTEYQQARDRLIGDLDHASVLRAGEMAAQKISGTMAAGNVLIFGSVTPMFRSLAAGTPPPSGLPDPLREAYDRYSRALTETDPVAATNGMLGANVLTVWYEQEQCQPYVSAAMNVDMRPHLHAACGFRFLAHETPLFEAVLHAVQTAWDCALTRFATTLPTPERTFDLAVDVPRLADGLPGPALLDTLTAPDPAGLVARFDRTDGTLVGSGARDWASLGDRMNYIVNLFRSRQQQADLLQPLPALPLPA